ncbi:MAG TPA: 5'-3' exonuclease H3TH domain-containing protein [Polyangiaceae bacterium]|nr:5'-3' exonuclease H3TH domain-containing protein [Polyangiaceae bacterium]
MQLHLIDGTFELFRAYFAVPKSQNATGTEVGAARGLLRSFAALLGTGDVTHVACAFDHVIESFRNDLFDGYKTGDGIDPDLYSQFGLAERVTRALGIVTWPMIEFEADDALATASHRFAQHADVTRVVIASPDKDLTQCLVDAKVVCWDRLRNNWLDAAGVTTKFGVRPESIPDYLALVGDTADGIPGVPRWGAKSAGAVLAEYVHLEDIPHSASDWRVKVRGAEALSQSLEAMRDAALLYRRLATLRRDVPLTEELNDLRFVGAPEAELLPLCEELGELSVLERLRANGQTTRA